MLYELWCGPVNQAQVQGAMLPGAESRFVTCTGDGHPTCGQMAEAWLHDGRVLPGLLNAAKIDLHAGDELWAGAFSAGGQIWKRVMMQAEDRAQIKGALMADAGYEARWIDEKNKIAPPVEGFVLYALDCLEDGRLFVWTASGTPNPSQQHPGTVYPAGDQVQDATRLEIEKRSGLIFEEVTDRPELWNWGAHLRAPQHVHRLRNVIFADYGMVYKHPEHALILAAEVWSSIPELLASGAQAPGAGTSRWGRLPLYAKAGLLLAGGTGAVLGGRALAKKR